MLDSSLRVEPGDNPALIFGENLLAELQMWFDGVYFCFLEGTGHIKD